MKRITNTRAKHDYQLLERFEAGIVLTGPEVKSIKAGQISLKESFVKFYRGEIWLFNAHVSPYAFADNQDYNPKRTRKLLLNKNELLKIRQKIKEKSLTIVPTACYNKGRNVKLEIALAKGKKQYQKREAKRKRDAQREMERGLKG